MKKLALVFTVLFSFIAWSGNEVLENTVPEVVSMNFHNQFPGASNVIWEKENSKYEAIYTESGKSLSVYYNTDGKIEEIDREISASELPEVYKNRLKEAFGNTYNILKLVVADDFSKTPMYVMQVQRGSAVYNVEFADFELQDQILHQQRQSVYLW